MLEQEFRDFLTCGCQAAGLARFRCASCRLDRLVPFSCRGRGYAVDVRAVLGWLRSHARVHDVADGRGGAVAIVQHFGAALNLNVQIHALVLDGVFAPDGAGGRRRPRLAAHHH